MGLVVIVSAVPTGLNDHLTGRKTGDKSPAYCHVFLWNTDEDDSQVNADALEGATFFLLDPSRVLDLLLSDVYVGWRPPHGYCCAPPSGESGSPYFNPCARRSSRRGESGTSPLAGEGREKGWRKPRFALFLDSQAGAWERGKIKALLDAPLQRPLHTKILQPPETKSLSTPFRPEPGPVATN